MRRKVAGMEFARVWGVVSRWPRQERADLVELIHGLDGQEYQKAKPQAPRKPKPESGTVTVEETDAVVKKMNLREKGVKPEGGTG